MGISIQLFISIMKWLTTQSLSDDYKNYKLYSYVLIGTIQYSSDSLCVCPCLCVCVCVCVCVCIITQIDLGT